MTGATHIGAGYAFGGQKAEAIRARIREMNRSQLAEHVAELGSVPRAAEAMGISHSYARVLWGEIKRSLGWQAR